jgi:LCP family protein required for cell wall assembly
MDEDAEFREEPSEAQPTPPVATAEALGQVTPTAPPASEEVGGAPRGSKRRQRRWTQRLVWGFGIFFLIVALLAGAGAIYAVYRFHQIKHVKVAHLVAEQPGGPVNILLIGDNCRYCLNGKQASAFGSASQVGGGRADVSMILHLDPKTKQATILSLPRDTFVPIPGTTDANRVDAALNKGPGALVQTIEDDFGITINRYVELNFDSFQGVVNALGGIDMYFPDPVRDYYSGLDVPQPGCYHLNGFQALAVVRARHLYYWVNGVQYYDGLGDISRIRRDHEFLRVLASELIHQDIFNPFKLNSVLGSILPQLTVDSGFGLHEMVRLALEFRGVNPNTVPTDTLPVYVYNAPFYYRGADYGDVVFPTEPLDQQVIDKMLGMSVPQLRPGTTVQVVDGSGLGEGPAFASKLSQLGLKVLSVGSAAPVSSPAESIVYYAPGEISQAEALLAHLEGVVAMGERSLPPGVDLQVVTGSYLEVIGLPAPKAVTTTTPASTTSPASSSTSSSAPASTTTTTTTSPVTATTSPSSEANFPGGIQNVIASHTGLAPWDPRACPPGATAKPLLYNQGPS